jgi:hypothetical protein
METINCWYRLENGSLCGKLAVVSEYSLGWIGEENDTMFEGNYCEKHKSSDFCRDTIQKWIVQPTD